MYMFFFFMTFFNDKITNLQLNARELPSKKAIKPLKEYTFCQILGSIHSSALRIYQIAP